MDHRIHQAMQPMIPSPSPKQLNKSNPGVEFKQLLQEEETLKVSKHAAKRLDERNVAINESQWQAINEKIHEARKKGITDSLVVLNDAALIVNAKNNTVVTAMDKQEATSRIFTNINGTILMDE